MRIARRAAPVVLLALVSCVFFGRCLVDGQTLSHDDLGFWFFPWKFLLRRMAQDGHIGFWLPWEFCGMPHMADIQRQIFYPPNVVFYVLPTAQAMVLFVGFHFFIASALAYLWLRQIAPVEPLEPTAALCGALVFGFSAFPVLHLSQLPMLASYAWIPGILLALERYVRVSLERGSVSLGWLMVGALMFTLMLLGGAPQMVYIACILSMFYLVFLLLRPDSPLPAARVALIGSASLVVPLLGVGLAGLQIVPMAEFTAFTARQPAVSSAWSSIGTMSPKMLWTLVHPYVFGNPMADTWTGGYTFHEECLYLGLVSLLLSMSAFGDVQRGGRRLFFFLACALVGVVIALGNHVQVGGVGLHDVFRVILPGFGKFRVPPRWMVLTVVGASVLAAFGAQALARFRTGRSGPPPTGVAPCLLAFAGFFALGGLVLIARREQGLDFEETRWAFALLFSTLTCAALGRLPRYSATASVALVLLTAADLLFFAGAYVRPGPDPSRQKDFDLLRELASRPGTGRILTHTSVEIPTPIATWCAPLGVRNVQGTNPLFLRSTVDYLYYSQAGRFAASGDAGTMHHNGFFVMEPVESALTRMLNLTDIVGVRSDASPPSKVWPVDGGRVDLVTRSAEGALGVAWAVPAHRVISEQREIVERMRRASWDPRSEVFLEEAPPAMPPASASPLRADISVARYEADLLALSVRLDRDAIVVFSEIFYPGWECTIDGRPAAILRANAIFRAVVVPAGSHEVVMRYRPKSFLIGLMLTVATALAMVIALVVEARAHRAR